MKKKLSKIQFILIILVISIIVSMPLLGENLNVYFDDGSQHISRAYSSYLSIINGENTTVLSNLTNEFGYSWNLFYGPFTTILILICNLVFNNFINAYKLAMFIGLFLSGLTMYKFMSKFSKNKYIGAFSAILYITMPYHLNDMYIRNAFGEFLSYIFIPLVFLGLYNLINKEKGDFWLCVGASGLLFTHNLTTAITAFFAFLYICANFSKLKDKKIIFKLIINIVLIILITAVFWVPLLETFFYTDYVVYQDGAMADIEIINDKSLEFKDFFTSDIDNTYVYEIGWHIVILLFLPLIAIKRFWKENKFKKEYILFLILGIFCLFMSTKYFPWEPLEKYLELIQFPWRMLVFANFFLSFVCAINVQIVIKNFKFKDNVFFAIICILYLLTLRDFIPVEKEITNIEEWKIGSLVTNKNQAIAGMGKGEYLPVKANESREYIMERDNEIYILEGEAKIENYSKNGQKLLAKITTNDSIIELPYIYYPGYTVTLDGEKQEVLETKNGFIGIVLEGSGTLEVEYTGTIIMKISKIISVLGMTGFIAYIIYVKNKKIACNIDK